jgi:hypothetical protein
LRRIRASILQTRDTIQRTLKQILRSRQTETGEMILAARRLHRTASVAEQGRRSHGAVARPAGDEVVVRSLRHV